MPRLKTCPQPSDLSTAKMETSLVVIGGGTGSFSVLSGLRNHAVDLSSIVTMMDSGGHSGVLRDAYGVLPPGDLRRCLIALSDESQILRDVFSFRFEEPPLAGHNLGNLFLLALTKATGSERRAIESISKMLNIKGRVIPVTWDHSHLNAELEDGEIIEGEGNIDVLGNTSPALPDRDMTRAIRRVFLAPAASASGARRRCASPSSAPSSSGTPQAIAIASPMRGRYM